MKSDTSARIYAPGTVDTAVLVHTVYVYVYTYQILHTGIIYARFTSSWDRNEDGSRNKNGEKTRGEKET